MADGTEVNSHNGSDIGACAELAFDDSSTTVLDSADIIPEAAMKCGILPIDGDSMTDLNDSMPTENLCLYIITLLVVLCCVSQTLKLDLKKPSSKEMKGEGEGRKSKAGERREGKGRGWTGSEK